MSKYGQKVYGIGQASYGPTENDMSRYTSGLRPKKRHILRGSGTGGEVRDLRNDMETAFSRVEGSLIAEGGIAVSFINKTGADSIKGTIVEAATTANRGVQIAAGNSDHPIGVIYENGIADGSEVLVVIYGPAYVLLKDGTASSSGNWVRTSDVAGRADATLADPDAGTHGREVGHSLETKTAGSNVLMFTVLHFS
ncbi:MAG: hypothetical protein ACXAEU_13710 [Candidatus Hodarchaeales archaeon]|jgi:hypothetical protein